MRKVSVVFLLLALSYTLAAQKDSSGTSKLGGLFKKANSIFTQSSAAGGSLTTGEISSGLKEALTIGVKKSADKLSAADGFFKDAAVRF